MSHAPPVWPTGLGPVASRETRSWVGRWAMALRWAAFCLVFYALPAGVLLVALYLEVDRAGRREAEERFRRLEQRLGRMASSAEVGHWLEQYLYPALANAGQYPELQRNTRLRLRRALPAGTQIVTLSGAGELVATMSDLSISRDDACTIWTMIAAVNGHQPKPDGLRLDSDGPGFACVRRALGLPLLNELHYGELIVGGRDPRRSWLYIGRPGEHGLMLVILPDLQAHGLHGLVHQIKQYERRSARVRFVTYDVRLPQPIGNLPAAAAPLMERAVAELSMSANARVQLGGWQWVSTWVAPTRLLIGVGPSPAPVGEDWRWTWGIALASLLVGVASALTWQLWSTPRFQGMSLRIRLLLLFFYTAGLPLSLLFVAAREQAAVRIEAAERREVDRLADLLQFIDRGFHCFVGRREATLVRALSRVRPGQDVRIRVRACLRWLRDRYRASTELSGETGRLTDDDPVNTSPLAKFLRLPALHAMASSNASVARYLESTRESLAESMLSTNPIFQSLDRTMRTMVGRFALVRFTGLSQVLTMAIPDADGVARHSAIVYWPQDWMVAQYLDRLLPALERRFPELTIAARLDTDKAFFTGPRRRLTEVRYPTAIFNLRLDTPGEVKVLRIRSGAYRGLIVGMHGAVLNRHQLMVRSGDELLLHGVRADARALLWWGVLVVLMVVVPGLFVVPALLAPIDHLQAGIDAIAERRFRTQLPVLSGDEFGALTEAFNVMLAGLADLDLAATIQHSLMPRDAVAAGPVAVCGSVTSATEVGGDYLDYLRLSDGRWLVVVGDVSGHGAAAGMVMAMAKAVVVHADTPRHDPAELLMTLNRVLGATVAGRRMMTCCVGIIDADGRRVQVANAGHWPPLLVRGGAVVDGAAGGLPVGVAAAGRWRTHVMPLDPGDRLFFFTDGLIESPLFGTGTPIGEERLRQDLPGLLAAADPQFCQYNVFSWYRRLAGMGAPPDDVTTAVVVIGDGTLNPGGLT